MKYLPLSILSGALTGLLLGWYGTHMTYLELNKEFNDNGTINIEYWAWYNGQIIESQLFEKFHLQPSEVKHCEDSLRERFKNQIHILDSL